MTIRRTLIAAGALVGSLWLAAAQAALAPMDEGELRDSNGQALFTSQFVNQGSGGNTNASTSFYRMSLNTEMRLNANINNLKLGCGGVNGAGVCDIDIGQVRLMGNNGSGGPGNPVTSDFIMNNPYIELAIDNNATASSRRVTGFRIGAANVNGYMGIGQDASTGAGSDSGINRFSGYMNVDMRGSVDATVCWGGYANASRTGCTGWLCCVTSTHHGVYQKSVDISGRRMDRINVNGLQILMPDLFNLTFNANISESLRYVHGINVNSPDFFLSWQNKDINWQNVSNGSFPSSGSAQTATPGWWMAIPRVEMHNLYTNTWLHGYEAAGGAFGVPMNLSDIDLGQNPPTNCYAGRSFC